MNTQEIAAIANDDVAFKMHVVKTTSVMENDIGTIKGNITSLQSQNTEQFQRIGKLEAFNKKVIGIVVGITAGSHGIPAAIRGFFS